jgi:ATP-dependent helicase HrpB
MNFPVDAVIPALSAALTQGPSAILVAEPGAGKTTRVPLALIDAPWLKDQKIVMLEPRRLAARMAARRMAETLGEDAGGTVGYTVRLERKISARTRIEVVTEGIMTRRLQTDPELKGVGLVIFDEFHERNLDGDLGLALCLDVQRGLRDDLKILIMSATLDAERLSAHLGGAPVINATGRVFPVETRHLGKAQRQTIASDAARAIEQALRETKENVLVFLPGESEIKRTAEALTSLPTSIAVHPLYGALSFAEQDAALKPAPAGTRKVVLATTIAETSLTIEGIGAVIDTGLKRTPRFDPASGMTRLETVRVSLASADQRRGRAGRLGPGVCYRLWPGAETRALAAFDPPEILVSDLAPLALELAAWGVSDPSSLTFLDQPPAAAFAQARDLLQKLDAIDASGAITTMGKAMTRAPLHPRLAHMVLKAEELGSGHAAAELAAFLSEGSGLRQDSADIGQRLAILRGTARNRMQASAKQIAQSLKLSADRADISEGVMLALAWPDRIAQKRGGDRRYRLSGGGGAVLAEHDPLSRQAFLAVALTDGVSGDQRIHLAAPLTLIEIETHLASQIAWTEIGGWDSRSKSVVAARQRRLGALVLEDRALANVAPEVMVQGMLEGIGDLGLKALPWSDEADRLRTRVAFLRRIFPDMGWPDLSDPVLLATRDDWLAPYLAGMARAAHLERLDMAAIMTSLIPHDLQRQMDELAPRRFEVPSGAHVTIDYGRDGDPVARVRLQEMFGLATTPKIARGAAQLRIEMLSPAGRPVAITQSLETFWTNGYPDVRNDLRGRYPKHFWPEDPLSAKPVQPRRLR